MKTSEAQNRVRRVAAFALMAFFFFRLITDFVAAIYAFGLMGTNVPPEIVSTLFFFSPLVLLLRRRPLPRVTLLILGAVVALSAAAEVMLSPGTRMLVSGLGVGACLVLLPALFAGTSNAPHAGKPAQLAVGVSVGLAASAALRVWNSGVDPWQTWWYRALGWAMTAAAIVLLSTELTGKRPAGATSEQPVRGGFGRIAALSVGMVAGLMLLYSAFASPNVLARWTGSSYVLILAVMGATLTLFALWVTHTPGAPNNLARGVVLAWNGVFVASLVATILLHQVSFPADAAGYPLGAPMPGRGQDVPLVLVCALFPVVFVDLAIYGRQLARLRPGVRSLAGAFAIASTFALAIVLAQVFTTVYDYIPVVGPLFRDKFWLVFLLLGLAAALPTLLARKEAEQVSAGTPAAYPAVMALLALLAVVGALSTAARPPAPAEGRSSLRVLTYNVQQGYDTSAVESHAAQLAVLRSVDADVIGLQETDTNRIAGGNMDLVRYFADNLDMYSYYGPNVTVGTFGIALLSRYPILHATTFYMYSVGEQTAAILAQIQVGARTVNVLVTHLGNGGPIAQQEAVLAEAGTLPNLIAMGDFNFRPDTEQYRLTTAALDDAWLLRWPSGVDDAGHDPSKRIDHVFLSPGTGVTDARYLTGPESDHPALVVEVAW